MAKQLSKKHRAALEPFGKMILAMNAALQELNHDQLTGLKDACDSASTTNCGWHIFKAAQSVRHEVVRLLHWADHAK